MRSAADAPRSAGGRSSAAGSRESAWMGCVGGLAGTGRISRALLRRGSAGRVEPAGGLGLKDIGPWDNRSSSAGTNRIKFTGLLSQHASITNGAPRSRAIVAYRRTVCARADTVVHSRVVRSLPVQFSGGERKKSIAALPLAIKLSSPESSPAGFGFRADVAMWRTWLTSLRGFRSAFG